MIEQNPFSTDSFILYQDLIFLMSDMIEVLAHSVHSQSNTSKATSFFVSIYFFFLIKKKNNSFIILATPVFMNHEQSNNPFPFCSQLINQMEKF